jgi:hypothetical protein
MPSAMRAGTEDRRVDSMERVGETLRSRSDRILPVRSQCARQPVAAITESWASIFVKTGTVEVDDAFKHGHDR